MGLAGGGGRGAGRGTGGGGGRAVQWGGFKGGGEGVGGVPGVRHVVDLSSKESLELGLEATDEGVEVVRRLADGEVGNNGLEFGGIGGDGGGLLDGIEVLTRLVLGEGDAQGSDHGTVEGGEAGEATGEGEGSAGCRSAARLPPLGGTADEEEGADVVDTCRGGDGEGGAEVEPGMGSVEPCKDLGGCLAVKLVEGGDGGSRGEAVEPVDVVVDGLH